VRRHRNRVGECWRGGRISINLLMAAPAAAAKAVDPKHRSLLAIRECRRRLRVNYRPGSPHDWTPAALLIGGETERWRDGHGTQRASTRYSGDEWNRMQVRQFVSKAARCKARAAFELSAPLSLTLARQRIRISNVVSIVICPPFAGGRWHGWPG
jgi:hypothetical protein